MPKSNTRITVALLMFMGLFAAVWAGAHGLRNPFADREQANSEASEKNLVSRSPSTLVKAVGAPNNPPSQPPGPISSSVISGGGGTSSSGSLTLDGTLGETSAASRQAAGTFTLDGGFWNMPQDFAPTPSPSPSPSTSPSPSPSPSSSPSASPSPSPATHSVKFVSSVYLFG